jgi:hypothetical protein
MEILDFLDEIPKDISDDKLDQISELCTLQQRLEFDVNEQYANKIDELIPKSISIKTIEEVLKRRKEKLRKLKQELIPSILNEVGLMELRLRTGEKIIVNDKVKPNITKANMEKAKNEMIELEIQEGVMPELAQSSIESMFKEIIETQSTEENMKLLIVNNVIFDIKTSIHSQTLAKYCRDRLAEGKPLPKSINCFQFQETKIIN